MLVTSPNPTETKTNTRDMVTTQPFTDVDYSSLPHWVVGFKPHYIVSNYGFNPNSNTD